MKPTNGHVQRAILERLAEGPAVVSELARLTGRPPARVRTSLYALRVQGKVAPVRQAQEFTAYGTPPVLWRLHRPREILARNAQRDEDVLQTIQVLGAATINEVAARSGWGRTSVWRSVQALRSRRLIRQVIPNWASDDQRVRWAVRV